MSRQPRHRLGVVSVAVLSLAALVATAAACQQTPPGQTAAATSAATSASRPAGVASSSASPDAKPATITIVGSGDVLLHPPLWDQARTDARARGETGYDFRPLFAGVRDVIASANLAICHMETPVAPAAGPLSGYPRFSVPPQVVPALADLGYDSCSTASNHTIDQGEAGVDRTLDAFDAAHIKHAGSYRSKADHDTVNLIDVHGVIVAHLSYAFGFNGLTRPAGKPWLANQIDTSAVLAEAKRARAQGAKIVVVSLHFGTEYQHAPNSQQLSVAHTLLASPDVDLILGHHAHVVQPFEKIDNKWVAYGMGNEVAHHGQPVDDNREGVLARFTFQEVSPGTWTVARAEAIPIWMDLSPNNRLVSIATALASTTTASNDRSAIQAAWQRIRGYLVSRGADRAGLHVAAA